MTQVKETVVNQTTQNPWFIEVDKNGKIISILEQRTEGGETNVRYTHFKDKLDFLSAQGYTLKDLGVPSLEAILQRGLKPTGVLIEKDGILYNLTEEVLQNPKSIEIVGGTAYFTLECPAYKSLLEEGKEGDTVTPATVEVNLFINQFATISMLVTNGVSWSLGTTKLKTK